MFTKKKKVGEVHQIRKFDAHKKVIDWEVVIGAVIVGLIVLALIGGNA